MQKLLYAIVGLCLLLIVIGLALPGQAVVSVSTRIHAYPATIFALLNDFDRVVIWSPWLESDPNARIEFSGPARGEGASMTWEGSIIGSGRRTITASEPFSLIEYAVNPGERVSAYSRFEIEAVDDRTDVTWQFVTDYGVNLVGRYFAPLFASIARRDCERGLVNLKILAESLPIADFSDLDIEEIIVDAKPIAYRQTTSRPDAGAMSAAMGDAFFEILSFIDAQDLEEAGPPMSITRAFSGTDLVFDAAIPIQGLKEQNFAGSLGVRIGSTYAGRALRVRHIGPYRKLTATHRKIAAYLAAMGIERNGDAWEVYVSDPTKAVDKERVTDVYYPIQP